ncbi:MAG: phosphoribosyl-ATP diphosphatase [Asgard group archaeon]|nr:phosphoribosyl-ATP diphosphatase [Asgard group archaeon]
MLGILSIKLIKSKNNKLNTLGNENELAKLKAINMVSPVIFDATISTEILANLPDYVDWSIDVKNADKCDIASIHKWISLGVKKIILPFNIYSNVSKQVDQSLLILYAGELDYQILQNEENEGLTSNVLEKIQEFSPRYVLFDFSQQLNLNNKNLVKLVSFLQKKLGTNILVKIPGKKITELKSILKDNIGIIIEKDVTLNLKKLYSYFLDLLRFNKKTGLIPVIARENDEILMVAYANYRTLTQSLFSQKMTYFSRSRNKIWIKGKTSGNTQKILKVRYDCDKDTILADIKQKGVACHLGQYSCFGEQKFTLNELYQLLKERIQSNNLQSYTKQLSLNEKQLLEKIREESLEVINYQSNENLIWEISDLTYFILVLMAKKGITLENIRNELRRRRLCQ